MYKIYDITSVVFDKFTEEEKLEFFNEIKTNYNENTIKWYLTNLNAYKKFLDYLIKNPC